MNDKPLGVAVVQVTPYQQNCSVIWCTKTMKGAVVDPGGELDRILMAVTENGVTLEKILITHAHRDHAGATAELQGDQAGGHTRHGVQLCMSRRRYPPWDHSAQQ